MSGFLGALAGLAAPVVGKAVGSLFGKSSDVVGGLVSSVLGGFSSSQQNGLNYDQQLALQQQGQQWQEHIIDKQNAWNSAPEQAKRYREAGINPVLALGSGSSGIVSSGGSSGVNSAPPAQDASMLGIQYKQLEQRDRELDMNSSVASAQADSFKASAQKSREEAETESKSRVLKIASLLGDTQKQRIANRILRNEEQISSSTVDDRISLVKEEAKQSIERTSQMVAQTVISKFQSENISRKFNAELQLIGSQIQKNFADIQLAIHTGNAQEAAAKAYEAKAQLDNLNSMTHMYSKTQLEQIKQGTVDSIVAASQQAQSDASWRDVNNAISAFTNALLGVGAAAVGFGKIKGLMGKGSGIYYPSSFPSVSN